MNSQRHYGWRVVEVGCKLCTEESVDHKLGGAMRTRFYSFNGEGIVESAGSSPESERVFGLRSGCWVKIGHWLVVARAPLTELPTYPWGRYWNPKWWNIYIFLADGYLWQCKTVRYIVNLCHCDINTCFIDVTHFKLRSFESERTALNFQELNMNACTDLYVLSTEMFNL